MNQVLTILVVVLIVVMVLELTLPRVVVMVWVMVVVMVDGVLEARGPTVKESAEWGRLRSTPVGNTKATIERVKSSLSLDRCIAALSSRLK